MTLARKVDPNLSKKKKRVKNSSSWMFTILSTFRDLTGIDVRSDFYHLKWYIEISSKTSFGCSVENYQTFHCGYTFCGTFTKRVQEHTWNKEQLLFLHSTWCWYRVLQAFHVHRVSCLYKRVETSQVHKRGEMRQLEEVEVQTEVNSAHLEIQ